MKGLPPPYYLMLFNIARGLIMRFEQSFPKRCKQRKRKGYNREWLFELNALGLLFRPS